MELNNAGVAGLDGRSRYGTEDEAENDSSVFVKYNRMLHGKKTQRGQKRDTLTIKFLKKYIHYAKHRIHPELNDEASEHIATAYAELRNDSSNAKTGGTLPITARTLETIIRLSTAHAKMKLSRKFSKSDVEAALRVLNFAIYHKELTEMEEREQERQKEQERNHRVERPGRNDRADHDTDDIECSPDAMEVDEAPAAESGVNVSPQRIEAFNSIFGQHMRANRLDLITKTELEEIVNTRTDAHYSRAEIVFLLERLQDDNRVMISDGMVHMIS